MKKIFFKKLILNIFIAMTTFIATAQSGGRYATVNGLKIYYELHGSGFPLVLLHGGGSTIQTTFGQILPALSAHHQVIAVELQAHGHTGDRGVPSTFSQDADDVAELLRQLGVTKADFFGFSNGGHTALELALRHPALVHKLVLASMFYKKSGAPDAFWEGMKNPKFSDMPAYLKEAYLKINPDSAALRTMFTRDAYRMQHFQDWSDEQVRSVTAPVFVVVADHDVPTPQHAVQMSQLLPHNRLAILPGGHGGYMGEAGAAVPASRVPGLFAAMLEEFLAASGGDR